MKTINFKIISNKNENIYQEGYVEVPEDVEQTSEWFYYDQNGFAIPIVFTHHDEIGITQIGATDEQEADIEEFNRTIMDEIDFINDAILNAEEDENKNYVRNDITIIVNDGAKFEVEFEDYNSDWDCDYYMAITPKFNEEIVELSNKTYFEDPYTYEQTDIEDILYEKGAYIVEIPKVWWEDPNAEYNGIKMRDEIVEYYTEAFEQAYRRSLAMEIGIFGIASSMYEEKLKKENSMEVFNESGIQDFGNAWEDDYVDDEDLWILTNLTSEDVEKAVKDAWEEEESLREYP